uniref:Uncharacterized protein n=1 Tax=Anguilla anguilla TaxID=7936 RepID=A0A0E9SDX4_ANGAN
MFPVTPDYQMFVRICKGKPLSLRIRQQFYIRVYKLG